MSFKRLNCGGVFFPQMKTVLCQVGVAGGGGEISEGSLCSKGTESLNKYDQWYKLSLYMFEAGPRHLLAHVTTLTPLLICNCPQLVRNTTLGEESEHAACILQRHSCLHSRSPCVCYSTRSRFHGFCFRCNNLILVGQPGRWKQQTAQNGLSLLVSLAKGLCPSRLHLQQTANPVYVQGEMGGGAHGVRLHLHRHMEGVSASALTSFFE